MTGKRRYSLANDYVDQAVERGVLVSLTDSPERYWALSDGLPLDVFVTEPDAWLALRSAMLESRPAPALPDDWAASSDIDVDAARLVSLWRQRGIADIVAAGASELKAGKISPLELAAKIEEEAARLQSRLRDADRGRLVWASELLGGVLEDARTRAEHYVATGSPVIGLPSSLPRLDEILGGLDEGLVLLAGAPGVGKTTLAMQIAGAIAESGAPVVYVTFENSADNLARKAIAAKANVNPLDVRRGVASLDRLREGAELWRPIAERMVIVEGSSELTTEHVRSLARRAMHQHSAEQCLLIVDYLQLWAKSSTELRGLTTVRERVEALGASLRDVATKLRSPVLALASQNRSEGGYDGDKKGSTNLSSLKESGDLEYGADVVLFLTPSKDRSLLRPARAVDLTIAKNRNGDTGSIELVFRPDVATLREA